jgi:3-oxoacyl-[acyl-carrier-protein] synthase II
VVTGLGVASAAGCGATRFWDAVLRGECSVQRTAGKAGVPAAATYQAVVDAAALEGELDRAPGRPTDRVVQLATVACSQAWQDAGLACPVAPAAAERMGLVLGSGLGGIQFQEDQMWRVLRSHEDRIHPHTTPRVSSTAMLAEVAHGIGLRGPGHVVNSACASSAHALGQAMRATRYGDADVMVAGGAEAPLTHFSLLAFSLLGVLSRADGAPVSACKPFDERRDGFVLGEGAAALVLEEADHARNRGARVYARLSGYGQSLGAYHAVHARPDGTDAAAAMVSAIRDAGLQPSQVGYVNAHGTATRENDLAEARAMRLVFGGAHQQPPISSIKPVTGHTLGAAGALEAVATVKALEVGIMPPNANLGVQDPACEVRVLTAATPLADSDGTRVALSNSFGFGNVNVSLVFERNSA